MYQNSSKRPDVKYARFVSTGRAFYMDSPFFSGIFEKIPLFFIRKIEKYPVKNNRFFNLIQGSITSDYGNRELIIKGIDYYEEIE